MRNLIRACLQAVFSHDLINPTEVWPLQIQSKNPNASNFELQTSHFVVVAGSSLLGLLVYWLVGGGWWPITKASKGLPMGVLWEADSTGTIIFWSHVLGESLKIPLIMVWNSAVLQINHGIFSFFTTFEIDIASHTTKPLGSS